MKPLLIFLGWTILLLTPCWAGEHMVLADEKDKINYSIGWQVGGDLKRQGVGLNPAALVRGIEDALADAEPLLSAEEMRTTLIGLKRRILAAQQEQSRQAAEQYREEGRELLERNRREEGVETLPSGLQYRVLTAGSGRTPGPHDRVTVHYRGELIDGTEFDSSYREGKPATFRIDRVIPGWREALPLMKEGARWRLFLPADLAFGERGPLADRTVIYEIELLAVQPETGDLGEEADNPGGNAMEPPIEKEAD